jgi:putative endonuclease
MAALSMDYYIYILASPKKQIYIGVTNDLRRRLLEHRSGMIPGFSKSRDCQRLVYFQHFTDIRYAIMREKQLKGWRRSKKLELIGLFNPPWTDLTDQLCRPSIREARRLSQGDKRGEYI